MTLHEFATQYFGEDREYYYRAKFIDAIGMTNVPLVVLNGLYNIEVDMQKTIEWLVYYCEDLLAQPNFQYRTGSMWLYLPHTVSENAIGALMILCSLHDHISIQHSAFVFSTKLNNAQIKRKDAAQIVKLVLETTLKEVYAQYPALEFEKLIGITQEQRYENLF